MFQGKVFFPCPKRGKRAMRWLKKKKGELWEKTCSKKNKEMDREKPFLLK